MNNAAENRLYTYADYKNYPEGERIEIIDGHIYDMVAAPSRIHQEIISSLLIEIGNYIKSSNAPCKVYPAPFDVLLTDEKDTDNCKNIVQPDISVICDKSKLTDKGCTGAPDMIIEVVSPFNPSNDYVRKLNIYEQYKVREYWIINPMEQTVFVYRLDDTLQYAAPKAYTFNDTIEVGIYNGNFKIDFSTLEV